VTGAGAGAGATYGTSGGSAGAAIGGGAGGAGGAGGGFWLHAATSAKADAIISGLANLTNALSFGGNHTDQDSGAFVQPKEEIFSRYGISEPQRLPEHSE
jgi:hypothetical protein